MIENSRDLSSSPADSHLQTNSAAELFLQEVDVRNAEGAVSRAS
jgi:hypothetical protein